MRGTSVRKLGGDLRRQPDAASVCDSQAGGAAGTLLPCPAWLEARDAEEDWPPGEELLEAPRDAVVLVAAELAADPDDADTEPTEEPEAGDDGAPTEEL